MKKIKIWHITFQFFICAQIYFQSILNHAIHCFLTSFFKLTIYHPSLPPPPPPPPPPPLHHYHHHDAVNIKTKIDPQVLRT